MLTDSNLAEKKLDIIQWISGIENQDIIQQFLLLKQDFINNSELSNNKPSATEVQAVLQGFEDMQAGRVVPHDEVKKIYAKWL